MGFIMKVFDYEIILTEYIHWGFDGSYVIIL